MTPPNLSPAPLDVRINIPDLTQEEIERLQRCQQRIEAVLEEERCAVVSIPICSPDGVIHAETTVAPLRLNLALHQGGLPFNGNGKGPGIPTLRPRF